MIYDRTIQCSYGRRPGDDPTLTRAGRRPGGGPGGGFGPGGPVPYGWRPAGGPSGGTGPSREDNST